MSSSMLWQPLRTSPFFRTATRSSRLMGSSMRTYATEIPPTATPMATPTPSDPAVPKKPLKPFYARPPPRPDMELPRLKKRWPIIMTFIFLGVGSWASFLFFATNQEKLSSSVVSQIMRSIRENANMREMLGGAIRQEPAWYLNGDPYISGAINQLSGNVDVSMRVKGSRGAGTLYFTSVRKAKGEPFTILRFKVIGDDGSVVELTPREEFA